MQDTTLQTLRAHYQSSRRYQTEDMKRRFLLTFEEFLELYPQKFIRAIENKYRRGGQKEVDRYMAGDTWGPVLGWRDRELIHTGVVCKEHMIIEASYVQRGRFRMEPGSKHKPESIEKMKGPKSQDPEAIARRKIGQQKRRERERLAKEQANG